MGKLGNLLGTVGPKILGALVLIAALASAGVAMFDNNPDTHVNLEEIMGALGGVGLMNTRANRVTSEAAGALGPEVKAAAPVFAAARIEAAAAVVPSQVESAKAVVAANK